MKRCCRKAVSSVRYFLVLQQVSTLIKCFLLFLVECHRKFYENFPPAFSYGQSAASNFLAKNLVKSVEIHF